MFTQLVLMLSDESPPYNRRFNIDRTLWINLSCFLESYPIPSSRKVPAWSRRLKSQISDNLLYPIYQDLRPQRSAYFFELKINSESSTGCVAQPPTNTRLLHHATLSWHVPPVRLGITSVVIVSDTLRISEYYSVLGPAVDFPTTRPGHGRRAGHCASRGRGFG